MDTKYNGWTNYATWRVNLEMFDGFDPTDYDARDVYELGQILKDLAELHLHETADGLAHDWALAFISDVNWHEIAQHCADAFELFTDEVQA